MPDEPRLAAPAAVTAPTAAVPAHAAPAAAAPAPANPPAVRANPVGDKFHDLADDGRRYRIHTNVGPFRAAEQAGAFKAARDFGPGADLPRLLALGAISEVPKDELDAIEAERRRQQDAATAAARGEAPADQGEGTSPATQVEEVPVVQRIQAGESKAVFETGPGEPGSPQLARGVPPPAVPVPGQGTGETAGAKAGEEAPQAARDAGPGEAKAADKDESGIFGRGRKK
jgi:hypothetical protein